MYSKILVPLDGSSIAELAGAHAAELSRFCHAELLLIRVCSDRVGMRAAVDYLDEINQLAHFEGLPARCEARIGEPAAEIVAAARENDVDLIVISSHGRTGLARTVFGSVAEEVLHGAPCPVMVVKSTPDPPEKARAKKTA